MKKRIWACADCKNITKIMHSIKKFDYFVETKVHVDTRLKRVFNREAGPLAWLESVHEIST